jgi:hypothetical protein
MFDIKKYKEGIKSEILLQIPAGSIPQQVLDDIAAKVDKVTGYSLVADTEISKIHTSGSDNQDLSGLVSKETNKSLVSDILIANIHTQGSDNQDLSGLQPKETGKGLSANDLTSALKTSYDGAVTHAGSSHAPTTAQANADITKAEIEAKLTGTISSHSHAGSAHTQGTDQSLDFGGANEVSATQTKTAYTHSQSTHAPSTAQKNSDIIKSEVEAVLTGELTSHSHANTWKSGIATKNITDASTVQNIPHGLGRVPKFVEIDGAVVITAAIFSQCKGIFDGANCGMAIMWGEGTSTAATEAIYTSTSIALGFTTTVATNAFTGANRQTGVISVDATNIIITWTKTGTVGSLTASLIWKCT